MTDWIPYLVYLIASLASIAAFSFKSIYWLRGLTILSSFSYVIYYSVFQPRPMWLDIGSESIVVLVNIIMIVVLLSRERKVSFSDEEREVHEGIFPELSPFEFFKLIRTAKWSSHHKGERLIKQGEKAPLIYLIYNGSVQIHLSKDQTILLQDGYFLGERSFMTGDRANADVIVQGFARTISWSQDDLRSLLQRNPGMNHSFSAILSKDISKKLYG